MFLFNTLLCPSLPTPPQKREKPSILKSKKLRSKFMIWMRQRRYLSQGLINVQTTNLLIICLLMYNKCVMLSYFDKKPHLRPKKLFLIVMNLVKIDVFSLKFLVSTHWQFLTEKPVCKKKIPKGVKLAKIKWNLHVCWL